MVHLAEVNIDTFLQQILRNKMVITMHAHAHTAIRYVSGIK